VRRGFTMIEILAVMVLLGLAAGVVAVNIRGPMREASLEEVVERIVDFDGQTRAIARRKGRPLRLRVDLTAGRLSRSDAETGEELGAPAVVLGGWRVEELRVRDEPIGSGTATLSVSRRGLSQSYALLLVGPHGERRWLLCAGLSGHFTQYDSHDGIENILGEATRDHAD
jgi:type II secretion system protein H